MKTTKTIMGIISIVLFALIAFQSCAAGVVNAIEDNGDISGSAGMFVAFIMLIAGIVGLATRSSKGGGITAGVFYLLGGLMGISNYGEFSDLFIWSVVCFIFGGTFILGSLKMQKKPRKVEVEES